MGIVLNLTLPFDWSHGLLLAVDHDRTTLPTHNLQHNYLSCLIHSHLSSRSTRRRENIRSEPVHLDVSDLRHSVFRLWDDTADSFQSRAPLLHYLQKFVPKGGERAV